MRGIEEQALGILKFRQSIDLNVPDKPGMTIRGAVFCGEKAIQGAVVSDGVEVTTTDESGYYWLPSEKYHGYVFVTIPSGICRWPKALFRNSGSRSRGRCSNTNSTTSNSSKPTTTTSPSSSPRTSIWPTATAT